MTSTDGRTGGMTAPLAALFDTPERRPRWNLLDLGILAVWVAVVLFQISRHALWRDEVRALMLALEGDGVIGMLEALHGEGHPAVWYLIIRGAYGLFGQLEVLQAAAFVVALVATILLIFYSPFPRLLVLLLVSGRFMLHEYSVVARNYGIAALLLFAIAACYRRYRDRGFLLGALLFLLANTNVVATIMAGAFLLFWLLELLEEDGLAWTPKMTNFAINAVIAAAGAVVCAITILPTFNDAAARDWSDASPVAAALAALVNPGATTQGDLMPQGVPAMLVTLVLFASTAGLIPRRPALLAALAGLLLCALFYAVAASGYYRHAAIWLCYLIALYWISWEDIVAAWRVTGTRRLRRGAALAGFGAFVLLLGAQSLRSVVDVQAAASGEVQSRSADFGRFMATRPDLAEAVLLGEPDYLAEPMPYYVGNRVYLLRERRFGTVVRFTRSGQLHADLGEVLAVAVELRESTGAPVLILLEHRLDEITPGRVYREGYNWTFSATQPQIDAFLGSTSLLRRFGPAERETFDLYLLD